MAKAQQYSVKQLAKLAGVSVRTLHLYDQMGLLKPALRTEARYRLYGQPELLRLQQILFYKALDVPLQQIGEILDDPGFDLLNALEAHRKALQQKSKNIHSMLQTIDKTIQHLKQETPMNPQELYAGLPKETADAWRKEALEKYGHEAVKSSEKALQNMSKAERENLVQQQRQNMENLAALVNEDPASDNVQKHIAEHYRIIRTFWGTQHSTDKQAAAYTGLGNLYAADERFTSINGKAQPALARLMQKAMEIYAENHLK